VKHKIISSNVPPLEYQFNKLADFAHNCINLYRITINEIYIFKAHRIQSSCINDIAKNDYMSFKYTSLSSYG
jgi:hypothetical protein